MSYHCGLRREIGENEVPLHSAKSQCAPGHARMVPGTNSSMAGSYQLEVVESLSQAGAPVAHYTTRLTVGEFRVSIEVVLNWCL